MFLDFELRYFIRFTLYLYLLLLYSCILNEDLYLCTCILIYCVSFIFLLDGNFLFLFRRRDLINESVYLYLFLFYTGIIIITIIQIRQSHAYYS